MPPPMAAAGTPASRAVNRLQPPQSTLRKAGWDPTAEERSEGAGVKDLMLLAMTRHLEGYAFQKLHCTHPYV